jgi:hypothetical protein
MADLTITPGSTVLIAGFDDIPSHQFLVQDVFEDCITGTALVIPPFMGLFETRITRLICTVSVS